MELRHLRYFVAVAEALNYRRAAERLHVSQPALSKQIKDLEDSVGARLLVRDTGGAMLTPAGTALLDEARNILEMVDLAVRATRDAAAGHGGQLSIGSLGGFSASFLPPALAAFRARFPKVEVSLHETPMANQTTALGDGVIQVGFTLGNGAPIPSNLEATEVLVSRIAAALGHDHRLALRRTTSLSELAGEALLCMGDSERRLGHQEWMESIFAARGIRHRPIKRVNGFESLVALIAGGHGVSLLLPSKRSRGKDSIVFRRIQDGGDDLTVRLMAVWRKAGSSQLARNFVEVLRGLQTTRSAGR